MRLLLLKWLVHKKYLCRNEHIFSVQGARISDLHQFESNNPIVNTITMLGGIVRSDELNKMKCDSSITIRALKKRVR